tara:strand:+ start:1245 stop:1946 length:702 start_codon:yes stop_codon:yes gene_type:complete
MVELFEKPLVSIIMPVHNMDRYLESSIESFLKQSYKNKELVIVDDASTDNSNKIAESYTIKHNNIKLFTNKTKLGIPKSRNFALKEARGEFIGHLDADDILKRNAIKKATTILKKTKVGLVYSKYITINENGKVVEKNNPPKFKKENLKQLGWRHFGLYKKKVAKELGMFNEKLITCSDADLFMKIANSYGCKKINKYLYKHRKHSSNIGHSRPHCNECEKQKNCYFFNVWKK